MTNACACEAKYTLIYGGDDRARMLELGAELVRAYPGSRHGGSNSRKSAEQAIRSGRVGLVLILVRWASHPDVGALKAACRAAGVECRVCSAGFASVREELEGLKGGRKAA
jgi:hypothetical protein